MKKEHLKLLKQSIGSFITGLIICLILISCFASSPESQTQSVSVEPVCNSTPIVRTVVAPTPTPAPEFKTAGICKITAYCIEDYPHICNNGNASTTATGTKPTPGRTVAVDPSVIPLFSNVIINGHTYIAEDTGGSIKGNRVDIVFATHQEALDFGVQYARVDYVD